MGALRIDILSVVPELLSGPFDHSILNRARESGELEVRVHDLREWGMGKHKQLDDYQFGGGAGMVMMAEPIANAIDALSAEAKFDELIYMTPDGQTFDQKMANQLSLSSRILILCGHYKGIDERIRETYITKEISIGDYVLSGGELAAAVVVDAIARLVPGVIGDGSSALMDSFQDNLLAPPVYTRPREWRGKPVPEILLSGNFGVIEDWRHAMAVKRTEDRRPDLLDNSTPET